MPAAICWIRDRSSSSGTSSGATSTYPRTTASGLPPAISIASTSDRISTIKSEGMPTAAGRSEEHTSELQSLMRISYAVFCLTKKYEKHIQTTQHKPNYHQHAYTNI